MEDLISLLPDPLFPLLLHTLPLATRLKACSVASRWHQIVVDGLSHVVFVDSLDLFLAQDRKRLLQTDYTKGAKDVLYVCPHNLTLSATRAFLGRFPNLITVKFFFSTTVEHMTGLLQALPLKVHHLSFHIPMARIGESLTDLFSALKELPMSLSTLRFTRGGAEMTLDDEEWLLDAIERHGDTLTKLSFVSSGVRVLDGIDVQTVKRIAVAAPNLVDFSPTFGFSALFPKLQTYDCDNVVPEATECFDRMSWKVRKCYLNAYLETEWPLLLDPRLHTLKKFRIPYAPFKNDHRCNNITADDLHDISLIYKHNKDIRKLFFIYPPCAIKMCHGLWKDITSLHLPKLPNQFRLSEQDFTALGRELISLVEARFDAFVDVAAWTSEMPIIPLEMLSLDIQNTPFSVDDAILCLAPKTPRLSHFGCGGSWRDCALSSLIENNIKLKTVSCTKASFSCEKLREFVQVVGSDIIKLEIWDIDENLILDDEVVAAISRNCKSLRHLYLGYVSGVSGEGWETLRCLGAHTFFTLEIGSDTISEDLIRDLTIGEPSFHESPSKREERLTREKEYEIFRLNEKRYAKDWAVQMFVERKEALLRTCTLDDLPNRVKILFLDELEFPYNKKYQYSAMKKVWRLAKALKNEMNSSSTTLS